jgi:DNA-binding NtrC family response regulator
MMISSNTDILIVSGWYPEKALGAALLAACLAAEAPEIVACSQRRLPELAAAWAASRRARWRRIYISGVGLDTDPPRLAAALAKLAAAGTEVVWFGNDHPPAAGHPVARQCRVIHEPDCTPPEIVLKHLAGPRGPAPRVAETLLRLARVGGRPLSGPEAAWVNYLLACASRYRRFQDAAALPAAIRRLAAGEALTDRDQQLIREHQRFGSRELKGSSPAVRELWAQTRLLGREGNCRVLITGETGVGKESVAYLIHGHSPRASEGFAVFNCADLSPQLLGSRLFGHEKGAFTGAIRRHVGLFEQANHGTLFLDEVGELPLDVQAGLLRVLEEKRFCRLGGTAEIEVDVRIIAATNRDLAQLVRERKFREDLFYRLYVVPLHVPPLRERMEDIPKIVEAALRQRGARPLTERQRQALQDYDWPGNVRELLNFLERAAVLNRADFAGLLAEHRRLFGPAGASPPASAGEPAPAGDLTLAAAARAHVARVLAQLDGNKTRASRALGISVNTLKAHLRGRTGAGSA